VDKIAQSLLPDSRVMITGGLGFIGSNLAKRLVDLNAEVVLVDSLIPESGGNLFNIRGIEDRVQVHISDLRDETTISRLVAKQDYLFNLAAVTSHVSSMQNPYTDLEMNCRAQLSVLEACRKHNPNIKIVFTSTRQVYGKPQYLPVDERHPLRPVDVNGINKMAAEHYHILYHNIYGIRCCVLRLTNTYGPHMRVKDSLQMFLGYWIRLSIEGKPIVVYGEGTQVRDFNYVDDVVEGLLLAATAEEANGKILNLGSNDPISLKDLAKLLVQLNSRGEYQLEPFPSERRMIDIGSYYADYSLMHSILGWEPKISLKEGLELTLNFYKKHLTEYL